MIHDITNKRTRAGTSQVRHRVGCGKPGTVGVGSGLSAAAGTSVEASCSPYEKSSGAAPTSGAAGIHGEDCHQEESRARGGSPSPAAPQKEAHR